MSMQLTGVLDEGVDFYREFWQKVAFDFNGKEIFIDDPEVDTEKVDVALLVALEAQTDRLCEVMQETVETVHLEQSHDLVIRRLEKQESLFGLHDVLDEEDMPDELTVFSFNELDIKKRIGAPVLDLIEQAI